MLETYNLYNLEAPFEEYLDAGNQKPISIKNYLSDVRHFFGWLISKGEETSPLQETITVKTVSEYKSYLELNNIPHKTINRRLSTLRKFCSFCISQGWMKENPAKKITNISPLSSIIHHLSSDNKASESPELHLRGVQKIISNIKYQISKIHIKNQKGGQKDNKQSPPSSIIHDLSSNLGFQQYIAFLIILIFVSVMGAGIYNQFFVKNQASLAYPTTPTKAGRILSFQGRLTDTLSNPITTATNVVFQLYSVSSGGVALYNTGTCSTTPDQDGIFSSLIGSDCGSEIDASVFTENANIYLGVTVGGDAEMTPRQQIANVGYAINSETLQGLPPGTGTSVIPYINVDGNLLISASAPGIRSTSTSTDFTLSSAKATVIQSAGTGDIVLQATESGTLKFRTGGITDAYTRISVDNLGNVGIGTTAPAQKLDVAGTAQMTGIKMTTSPSSGYVLTSDATGVGSWTDVSGSAGPWTLSGSNLYPDSTAYNVGIGTTSPGAYKLNVNGNSNVTGTLNVTTSVSSPTFQGIGAAVTFGNASYGTTIAGSGLTVSPTAWTATPTISGLVTMTSGFDSNTASTVTALTIDGTAGTGDLTINSGETSFTSPATTANANIFYGNSLTSGNLLYLSSTSTALTTGSLASLDWSPGSALTATGDLLSLNIGANGNIGNLFNVKDTGSSLFSVSETAVTSNLPTSFTSSGDVSMAYDLNFTNPTASYIKSSAPLYIQAGETFNSSDLNLKTYNSGDVVLDAGGTTSGTGTVKFYDSNVKGATDTTPIGFAGASSDINTFRTNFTSETVIGSINEAYSAAVGGAGGLWLDGGTYAYPNTAYVTDVMVPSGNVGIGGTSAGTAKLYVNGNVGIGTTAPGGTLPNGFTSHADSRLLEITSQSTGYDAGLFLRRSDAEGLDLWYDGGNAIAYIDQRRNNDAGDIRFRTKVGGTPVDALTIEGSGNVGIGTTAPANKLDVAGTAQMTGFKMTTSPSAGYVLTSDAVGVGSWTDVSSTAGPWTLSGVNLYPDSTSYNVGIGTTAPLSKLGVLGNLSVGATYGAVAAPTSGAIFEGNVGIGTTGPTNRLHIIQASDAWGGGIRLQESAGSGYGGGFYRQAGATGAFIINNNGTDTVAIQSGNVGIGTTGPNEKLEIASGRLRLPQVSEAATPTLNFGDGDTGIYESSDDDLRIAVAGSTKFQFTTAYLASTTTSGAALTNGAASSTTPALTFTGDVDTGVGRAGSDILSLIAGGTNVLNVTAGNVGIGTTSPVGKLSILQTAGSGNIEFGNLGGGGGYIQIYDRGTSAFKPFQIITGSTTGLYQNTSGNVGIGTTTPAQKLDVAGTAQMTGFKMTTSPAAGYILTSDATGVGSWADVSSTAGPWTLSGVNLYPDSTSYNVGIGTTSPLSKLGVLGNLSVGATYGAIAAPTSGAIFEGNVGIGTTGPSELLHLYNGGTANDPGLRISDPNHIWDILAMNTYTGDQDMALEIKSSAGAMVHIRRTGNVGIGTTAPGDRLVVGNITGQNTLKINGLSTANMAPVVSMFRSGSAEWVLAGSGAATADLLIGLNPASYTDANLASSAKFYIKNSGNVGIGTTSPTGKLQLAGGNIIVDSTYGIDTAAAGTLNLGNTTATTVNLGNTAATTIGIGAGGSLVRAISIGTGTGIDTINIGTGATGVDVIRIGHAAADLALTDTQWSISSAGAFSGVSGTFTTSVTTPIVNAAEDTQWNYLNSASIIPNVYNKDVMQDYLQFNPPQLAETYNGSTWSSVAIPNTLFSGSGTTATNITNTTVQGYRVTWTSFAYRYLEDLFVANSTNGNTMTVMVEQSVDGSIWTSVFTSGAHSSWPGYFSYKKYFTTSGKPYLRITFTPTWINGNNIDLYQIRYFGGYPIDGAPKLYTWDYNKNMTIPGITTSLSGASSILNFSSATGVKQIQTGGTTNLALMPSGNVGIGTTAPAQKLDVAGTAQMTGFKMTTSPSSGYILTSDATGVGSWTDVSSTAGPWTLSGVNLYPDSTSYNVGIGTTAPLSKLGVLGNLSVGATYGAIAAPTSGAIFEGNVGIGTTGPGTNLEVYGANANLIKITRSSVANANIQYSNGTYNMYAGLNPAGQFGIGSTLDLTSAPFIVTSAGNVGIGTTSPADKLHVYESGAGQFSGLIIQKAGATTGDEARIDFTLTSVAPTDGAPAGARIGAIRQGANATSDLYFSTNNSAGTITERMRLTKDGNVGIGTTSPGAKLEVVGSAIFGQNSGSNNVKIYSEYMSSGFTGNDGELAFKHGGYDRIKLVSDQISAASNDFDFRIKTINSTVDGYNDWVTVKGTTGNVGIGTTAPAQKLDVAGTAQMTGFKMTTSPSAGYILTSDATGVGSWADVSSTAGPWTLSGVNLYPDSTSYNVGIGTTAPLSKLGVLGNLSVGATYGAIAAPTSGAIFEGNVGIGTTAPGAKLSFVAATTAAGGIDFGGDTNLYRSAANLLNTDDGFVSAAYMRAPYFQGSTTATLYPIGYTTNPGLLVYTGTGAAWSERMRISGNAATANVSFSNSNVGIGTTAPSSKFEITDTVGSISKNLLTISDTSIGSGDDIGLLFHYGSVSTYDTRISNHLYGDGKGALDFQTGESTQVTIRGTGNVGIGTTAPAQKLDVAGTAQMTGIKMTTSPVAGYALVSDTNGVGSWTDVSGSAGPWTLSGSNLYPDSTAYNVGIGTTAPGAYKLNVNGNSNVTGTLNVTTSVSSPIFQGIGAAVTFGNASYGTTIAGSSLTVSPTAWTATPTISGLVTMTSGFDSNTASTVTALTVDGTAGTGDLTINSGETSFTSPATTANANIFYGNSLTSGNLLSLSSTSTGLTTGSLASLDWSPGSALTATGDLLSLNIGANGNIGNLFNVKDTGSSLFSVSETAVISNLPTSFTSSGDVSIAYDLNFTNPTASYIKSSAPLYIQAGETFNSSDLNLKTYNSGDVVLDAGGSTTGTGTVKFYDSNVKGATDTTPIGFAGASSDINTFRSNFTSETVIGSINEAYSAAVGGAGGLWLDGGTYAYPNTAYVTDVMVPSGNVGIGGTSAGTAKLYVNGNVGIGTTSPAYGKLQVSVDNATNQSWDYSPAPAAYRLNLKQTVTSGVVRWNFSQVNNSTAYNDVLVLDRGNVGIGEVSPGSKLSVSGGGSFGASYDTTAAPSNGLIIEGNVGIGTTAPGYKLDVQGVQSEIQVKSTTSTNRADTLYIGGQTVAVGVENSAGGSLLTGSTAYNGILASIGNYGLQFGTNNTVKMTIQNNGNVGIGTTAPGYKLDVTGTGRFTSTLNVDSTANPGLTVGNGTTGYIKVGGSTIYDAAGNLTLDSDGSYTVLIDDLDVQGNEIIFGEAAQTIGDYGAGIYFTNQSYFDFVTEGANVGDMAIDTNTLFVDASANFVGIGTTSPLSKLGVLGNLSVGATYGAIAAPTSGAIIEGNVGIGTTGPVYKFQVANGEMSTGGSNLMKDADLAMGGLGWSIAGSYAGYVDTRTVISDATAPVPSRKVWKHQVTTTGPSGDSISVSQAFTNLQLNTDYTVSGYIKTTDAQGNYFNIERHLVDWTGRSDVGCSYNSLYSTNGNWYRVWCTFNTGNYPNMMVYWRGFSTIGIWYLTGWQMEKGSQTSTFALNNTDSVHVYSGSGNDYYGSINGLVNANNYSLANAYGSYNKILNSGTSTITNGYSVYIAAPTGTITNKYALVTEANAGNVGIGTTAPSSMLSVGSTSQFQVNSSGAIAAATGVISSGNIDLSSLSAGGLVKAAVTTGRLSIATAGSDYENILTFSNGLTRTVNAVKLGGTLTATTDIPLGGYNLTFSGTGNVGIGTSAPTAGYKLDVNGAIIASKLVDRDSTTFFVDPADSALSLKTNSSIEVGNNITVSGGIISTGSTATLILRSSGSTSVCVDTGAADCTGKIDAGTVDPPYTINGKNYATFLSAMIGVKEETTGIITTTQLPMINNQSSNIYGYTIDFSNEPEASDLWLFTKVTNLKKQIDQMTVLLTPSENTRSWYKIDKENLRLYVYSSRPTNISYRLTAPRFDSENWNNRRADDAHAGFIINDQGNITGPASSVTYNKAEISPQDFVYDGNIENFKQSNSLFTLTGDFVDEFTSVTVALIARLKAGFIEAENIIVNNTLIAKNIVVDNIQIAGKNINQLIDERIRIILNSQFSILNSGKIVSPIVETQDIIATGTAQLNSIATNEIKPQSGDLTIDLSSPVLDPLLQGDDNGVEKGTLARLIIKGLEGKTVTTIDSAGNASFSGQIIADSLQINTDATVAGNLAADSLSVRNANLRSLQSNEASISGKLIAGEIESSTINDIQKLLADIKNQPISDLNNQTNLSDASNLSNQQLNNETMEQLTVTGNSNLYNVSVSNSLLVGTTLFDQNSIISLASELKLSALAKINLFDGAVIIAKDGKITTRGEIIAKGGITVRNSEFRIQNSKGEDTAVIDASGSARFNNLAVNNLTINNISTNSAIIAAPDNFAQNGIFAPAIETATASAGIALLPENSSEVIIYNNYVKKDSLIYLTPTSLSSPVSLTIGQKEDCVQQLNNETIEQCKPYFTVVTNTQSTLPVKFNWLIVN